MTHDSHPISLLLSGLTTIAAGHLLGQSATEIDIVQKLLSMGGGAVGILLMGIGLRYMVHEKNAEKATREAIQKKLDEMHEKHLAQEAASTEARVLLAHAIEAHNKQHENLSLSIGKIQSILDSLPLHLLKK
jgi:ribulose 1,5-bisphosphate synthetase/thiazole synthase